MNNQWIKACVHTAPLQWCRPLRLETHTTLTRHARRIRTEGSLASDMRSTEWEDPPSAGTESESEVEGNAVPILRGDWRLSPWRTCD